MSARSGQITVSTAGTAVQGPSAPTGRWFMIEAHPDNTGTVWVGNDGAGDVTSSNGFGLDAGDTVTLEVKRSLAELWFDADTNGHKFCWILVNVS